MTSGNFAVYDVAADATHVYFTAGTSIEDDHSIAGSVSRVAIVPLGGTPVQLAPSVSPGQLLIDTTHVYWLDRGVPTAANFGTASIKRVPLAGGTVETVAAGLEFPGGIAADATHVYFGSRKLGKGVLSRAPKTGFDGGVGTTLFVLDAATPLVPASIVIDGATVYWIVGGFSAVLFGPVSGGTTPGSKMIGLLPGPLVLKGTSLFFLGALGSTNTVNQLAIGGAAATTLYTVPDFGRHNDIAGTGSALYWTEFHQGNGLDFAGTVVRAGLDGSNPTVVAAAVDPGAITNNATSVFFAHAAVPQGLPLTQTRIMQLPQ